VHCCLLLMLLLCTVACCCSTFLAHQQLRYAVGCGTNYCTLGQQNNSFVAQINTFAFNAKHSVSRKYFPSFHGSIYGTVEGNVVLKTIDHGGVISFLKAEQFNNKKSSQLVSSTTTTNTNNANNKQQQTTTSFSGNYNKQQQQTTTHNNNNK